MATKTRFVFVALALFISTVQAQQVTGNLEGRILDSQGQPLAETNITVTGPNLQGTRGSTSDKRGYFRILALPAGSYTVKISLLGYQTITYDNVPIRLGKTTFIGEIRLESQTIEMPAITVSGAKPLIDPASTTTGANLVAESYELLPIQRNYRSITTLLPHANESFLGDEVNFAGATGLENKYYIDGIDVTDSWRGITGTNLPYNFIKQIEVKTGGYEAEYRSALGGVVNAVTHSGGNEFHGQAFGFFANNRFAGEPRLGALEPNQGGFAQYDVGLSLGGPVIRDKLWFFAAYNPTFEREEVEIPGTGFYDDHSTTHIFAGKLSWRASEKNNLFLTMLGDPQKRRAVGETYARFGTPAAFANPDPYLAELGFGGVNMSLTGSHILNDRFLLETALSRVKRKDQYMPATERGRNELIFINRETGIWSGGYPSRVDDHSAQFSAAIKGTLIWGTHTFKTGVDYKDNRLDHDLRAEALLRFAPTSYLHFVLSQKGILHSRTPSVFAQDSWQASNRLRINIGLRWDGQSLVGSNGKVVQTITEQYQPRVGFVYQIGKAGSQKIFASFGRFYQELLLFLSTFYHIEGSANHYINFDHDPRINPAGGDSTISFVTRIRPEVKDLRGQHYDEFTLGYEKLIGENLKMGLRGIYRPLRQAIEDGFVSDLGDYYYGNPGKGRLSMHPKATREYKALELILEKFGANQNLNFLASYIFSRSYGNYPGFFFTDNHGAFPNSSGFFDFPELLANTTGLLPNDRTHVFKFSGSYRWNFGLTVGTSFLWQSGTPLSEFGGSRFPPYPSFIQQRGAAGRTPAIVDLNLRLVYDFGKMRRVSWQPRMILDVFHVASQRQPVDFEQLHYFNIDETGKQINPNPLYDRAIRYQPPMAMRLGLEIEF